MFNTSSCRRKPDVTDAVPVMLTEVAVLSCSPPGLIPLRSVVRTKSSEYSTNGNRGAGSEDFEYWDDSADCIDEAAENTMG